MDMRRTTSIVAAVLMIAVVCPFSLTQARPSGYDPANHQPPQMHRDTLVDFALKRLNAADTDYGKCLDEGRSMLVEETVKNAYFWSNVVALGMLGCLFIIVVFQHRLYGRREWRSAEILAQLEQSLARSDAQVKLVTGRNLSLAESVSALKRALLEATPTPIKSAEGAASRTPRSQVSTAPAGTAIPSKTTGTKSTSDRQSSVAITPGPSAATTANPGSQISLFKPEVELVTKVNALEQQLGRSQEMEKQLRRQLNDTGRKLQAEQERNRSLKADPA